MIQWNGNNHQEIFDFVKENWSTVGVKLKIPKTSLSSE